MTHEFDLARAHRYAAAIQRAPAARSREVAVLKKVLDAFGIHNCTAIADLGAGVGYVGHNLVDYLGAGGVVYAIDVSPTMLQLVQPHAQVRAVLVSYDHLAF